MIIKRMTSYSSEGGYEEKLFTSRRTKALRKEYQDFRGAGILADCKGYGKINYATDSKGKTQVEYFDRLGNKITGSGELGAFGDRSRNIKAYRDYTIGERYNHFGDELARRQKGIQKGETIEDLKGRMYRNLSKEKQEEFHRRKSERASKPQSTPPKPEPKPQSTTTPKSSPQTIKTSPSTRGSSLKTNPGFFKKHGGKMAIGAGVVGAGLLAYNHYKNKNKDNEQKSFGEITDSWKENSKKGKGLSKGRQLFNMLANAQEDRELREIQHRRNFRDVLRGKKSFNQALRDNFDASVNMYKNKFDSGDR